MDLGLDHAALLVVSVGINHVIENERLSVSIWGSKDGEDWGDQPLIRYTPKSYCGVYATFLNLSLHPEIRYVRANWSMDRCGRGGPEPMFGFYISAQESGFDPRSTNSRSSTFCVRGQIRLGAGHHCSDEDS